MVYNWVYNWVYNCLFPLLKSVFLTQLFLPTEVTYFWVANSAGNPQPSDGFNQAPPRDAKNKPLLETWGFHGYPTLDPTISWP